MQSNLSSFDSYRAMIVSQIAGITDLDIERISEVLLATWSRGGTLFLAGNGGSASIVEHAYTDLLKTIKSNISEFTSWSPRIRILTLPSSLLTAIANDIHYDAIFSWQIDNEMSLGDCLIAVSSSGNSVNILNAARSAKYKGGTVIAFCGFENPKLKDISDISVHVQVSNYGVVEDLHSICFHALTQKIISKLH